MSEHSSDNGLEVKLNQNQLEKLEKSFVSDLKPVPLKPRLERIREYEAAVRLNNENTAKTDEEEVENEDAQRDADFIDNL